MTLGLNQTYREEWKGLWECKRQTSLQAICAGDGGLPYTNIYVFANPNKRFLPERDYFLVSSVGSGGKLGCEVL